MELTLKRKVYAATFTLGMMVFGGFQYYSVEDTVRPLSDCTRTTCVGKIDGVTAIPAGRYEIKDTYSPRFKKNMLELQNVPGFQGIRVHPGNTAQDTEGCILLTAKPTPTGGTESRKAMEQFNKDVRAILARGERVWITIE